jgi:hypothetical protein
LAGARIRASPRRPACRIARHCHGENTRRTRPDLAARQSALVMVLCYLPFGTTYPSPAGHRGEDVLPAETKAGEGPQGSDATPQTAAVRRRLPTTAPRCEQRPVIAGRSREPMTATPTGCTTSAWHGALSRCRRRATGLPDPSLHRSQNGWEPIAITVGSKSSSIDSDPTCRPSVADHHRPDGVALDLS